MFPYKPVQISLGSIPFRVEVFREDGDELDVYAYHGDERVGEATGEIRGGHLKLCDLHIVAAGELYPGARGYRGLGLGAVLLKAFLREADALGIPEIRGTVTKDDLQKTPFLLTWYQRQGFRIDEPDDDDTVFEPVAKIIRVRP